MRRSSARALALAGLLLTAGCLGGLWNESPSTPVPASTTERPTASGHAGAGDAAGGSTPGHSGEPRTATPTASMTPDTIEPPFEVSARGISSPRRFADMHVATLSNTSFTIRYSQVRIRNGILLSRTVGVVRHDGNGTVYYNYTTTDPDGATRRQVAVWSNETTARRKVVTENGTRVEWRPPVTDARTFAPRIEAFLEAFDTSVTGYSRLGGEPTVRVSADALDYSDDRTAGDELAAQLFLVSAVEDGEFSAIRSGGMLRRYRVAIAGRGIDESLLLRERVAFANLGATTVRRPAWVTVTNASRGR